VCGSHLRHKSSLSFTHRLPRTLELMAAASSTRMQGIRTSILILYPRSAGAPIQRLPHRAPFQHHHSFPTNLETLLLSTTTTTQTYLVNPWPKVLRDRMAIPRASETYHRQNRLQKQRRRKFGCSKLSWPRPGLTPQQLLQREPSGRGGSVDRLRSRGYSFVIFMLTATNGRREET
jgi:hypothetical protein